MPWKPDYITVAEAAAYLRIPDAVDNTELQVWVTAASRAIDARCGRQFGQLATPAVRTYRRPTAYDPTTGMWLMEIDDVMDATAMTVNGVALASSGATLLPDNAAADGRPWTRLGFAVPPVAATPGVPSPTPVYARWGWTAFPVQVTGAARLQVSRWNARRDSPYGVAGAPGAELRLLSRLDPDVAVSLAGLSRNRPVG